MTTGDVVALGVLGLAAVVLAWQSLTPLRANVAVANGDQLLARGDGNAALAAYDRATELVPGAAVYWLRKGELLTQVQQQAKARSSFAEAAAQDPYDVNALIRAAALAEAQDDLTSAHALYERALEVDPLNPATLSSVATFELRHSGAERAKQILDEAVAVLPQTAELWATLGDARAVLGDATGARDAYERALELEPAQQTAIDGLAKLAA